MIFLVNDANILIDLLKINLFDTFFKLEFDLKQDHERPWHWQVS
jgi:hypothetical protein